jgi:hypothetical protein
MEENVLEIEDVIKGFDSLNQGSKLKVFEEISQSLLESSSKSINIGNYTLFGYIENLLKQLLNPENDEELNKANRVRKRLSIDYNPSEEYSSEVKMLYFISKILYLFLMIKRSEDGQYCFSLKELQEDRDLFSLYEEIDYLCLLNKQPIQNLMEDVQRNLKKVLKDLKEDSNDSKTEIYKNLGEDYGAAPSTIKNWATGNATSIPSEFILFLEQEYNIHRNHVLGPILTKQFRSEHTANLTTIFDSITHLCSKDPDVELKVWNLLSILVRRLRRFMPNKKTEKGKRGELDQELAEELQRMLKCMSSKK